MLRSLRQNFEDLGKQVKQKANDESQQETVVENIEDKTHDVEDVPTCPCMRNRGRTVHVHSNTFHQIQEMFSTGT